MAYTINGETIQGGATDSIQGGAGDDAITIAQYWAYVTGGDGNDTIFVDYGFRAHNSVTVHEGPGDDTISGADTVIYPGAFRDYVIDPSAYAHDPRADSGYYYVSLSLVVAGPDGNDSLDNVQVVRFGDGTSISLGGLSGGPGDDVFYGSSAVVYGNGGNDSLSGASGNETLFGGAGTDTLTGGSGDDSYVVDSLDTVIEQPGGGFDTVSLDTAFADASYTLPDNVEGGKILHVSSPSVEFFGNGLDNVITVLSQAAVVHGGDGNDTITGSNWWQGLRWIRSSQWVDRDCVFSGDAGNDSIQAGMGNDTIYGGTGDDVLDGGGLYDPSSHDGYDGPLPEVDRLRDDGNDSLSGGEGNDTLFGGFGNDELIGGEGDDSLDGGGLQADRNQSNSAYFPLVSLIGSGDDTLTGGAGNDTIAGGDGVDTAVFSGLIADYAMSFDAITGVLTVSDNRSGSPDGTDRLTGVENLRFLDGTIAAPLYVNSAPSGELAAALAGGSEDTVYTVTSAALLNGFSDADGDTLSVTGLSASHGTVAANADGSFTITPDTNFNGIMTLTYGVSDGHGGTLSSLIAYTVAAVNDAPTGELAATLADGSEDTIQIVTSAALLNGFSDADGDRLSVTGLSASHGTVAANADGSFTITPDTNFNGIMTLTYGVSDGHGGTLSNVTRTYSVAGTNDAPTVAGEVTATAREDSGVLDLGLLAGALDIETQALHVKGVTGLVPGLTLSGDRLLADTAAFQFLRGGEKHVLKVNYQISDGEVSASQTATITITGTNDAASITGGSVGSVTEDRSGRTVTSGHLNVWDADAGEAAWRAPSGDTRIGRYGQFTFSGGDWTYALDHAKANSLSGGEIVNDTLVVRSLDGSAAKTIDVTVKGTNDRPVAAADKGFVIAADETLTISTSVLLANDIDADGDTLAVTAVGAAKNGSVSMKDGSIVFTPDAGYAGEAKFSYNVSDGHGGTSTTTVTLTAIGKSVTGAASADHLTGSAGADTFSAGEGHDTVMGGAGNDRFLATMSDGSDLYDGGDGTDTLDLSGTGQPVRVSLGTPNPCAESSDGEDDALLSIENVIGSKGDDVISGSAGANMLNGMKGDDLLMGGGGNDTLIGGAGNDVLGGGEGADTFVFRPRFGSDEIVQFETGTITRHDTLDLRGLGFKSVQDVLAHTDGGASAVIHVGADKIVLVNVSRALLQSHAFDLLV